MLSKQDKVKALMSEQGLDAMLVFSPENFHYVTGHASHQHTVSRMASFSCVVVPVGAKEKTRVIVMDFEKPLMDDLLDSSFIIKKYDTWVGVRQWDELFENGEPLNNTAVFKKQIDIIAETIDELNLGNKKIGLELDFISYNFYEQIKAKFPELQITNVSELFIFARSVKTAEEVALFRMLTGVADSALNKASQLVRIGFSEKEVAQEYRQQVIASGLCVPSAWSMFSTGSNASRIGLPTDKRIANGDVFKFDGGVNAEFDFYTTDNSRTWLVGDVPLELCRLKETLYEALQKMIALARPGLPINELYHAGYEHVKNKYPAYRRGHMGHNISMGPQTAENPFITAAETRLLEENMILCFETPCYIQGVGGFNLEDMVVITKNGCEVLTHRTPHFIKHTS